jgi:hypothetical protein
VIADSASYCYHSSMQFITNSVASHLRVETTTLHTCVPLQPPPPKHIFLVCEGHHNSHIESKSDSPVPSDIPCTWRLSFAIGVWWGEALLQFYIDPHRIKVPAGRAENVAIDITGSTYLIAPGISKPLGTAPPAGMLNWPLGNWAPVFRNTETYTTLCMHYYNVKHALITHHGDRTLLCVSWNMESRVYLSCTNWAGVNRP